MAGAREEFEVIFITLVPSELHSLISTVDKQELSRLSLANDAISNDKFIFQSLRESFECDSLSIPFSNYEHLVLLVRIVLSVESKKELLNLCGFRGKADVECMVRLWCNSMIEVALEVEAFVLNDIESGSGSN